MEENKNPLRNLPSVDSILSKSEIKPLIDKEGRQIVTQAVRSLIEKQRKSIIENKNRPEIELPPITPDSVHSEIDLLKKPSLKRVINATGVVLHTNLGRAPIPDSSLSHLREIASGYCNLEYDILKGQRGSRYMHIEKLLCEITGAEACHIVNNNAAALLLSAKAIANGREVIVSRGELIEIGDSFRLPEIIEQSGAVLREVGTTNRTKIDDYEKAINENTAMIIKSHHSNFFMKGFVSDVLIEDLVQLGRKNGITVLFDTGSGAMELPLQIERGKEPLIRDAVLSGADIVTFSGDKLLGGPQSGIILGKSNIIKQLRKNPLTRALRPCKITLALLEHILNLYRFGKLETIPVYAMLSKEPKILKSEARKIAGKLRRKLEASAWKIEVTEENSVAGGGSLPEITLKSWVVRLRHSQKESGLIDDFLRNWKIPIVCRIHDGDVVIDPRTIFPNDVPEIISALSFIDTEITGQK